MSSSKYNKHLFPDGTVIRLKPLEVIMKEAGVTDRTKIENPYITNSMVGLFGNDVIICNTSKPPKFGYFQAKAPEDYKRWFFHPDWIDNDFKVEALPDELFEI